MCYTSMMLYTQAASGILQQWNILAAVFLDILRVEGAENGATDLICCIQGDISPPFYFRPVSGANLRLDETFFSLISLL